MKIETNDIILGIAALAFLFFALRSVFIWYYKIDKHLENQEKIIKLLEDLNKK